MLIHAKVVKKMTKSEVHNYYKNKRIFVTGHTGFKGSWLTKILLMAGAEVIGYSTCRYEETGEPRLFNLAGLESHIHHVKTFPASVDHTAFTHKLLINGCLRIRRQNSRLQLIGVNRFGKIDRAADIFSGIFIQAQHNTGN